jgi:protein tyrosine phosphatase (PTP) superfamily phosphohydrolase (DUF442 family)
MQDLRNFERITDAPGLGNLFKIGNFYIASQPAEESFVWIKSQGVKTIINLRDADEMDFRFEEKACASHGLGYHQFPVTCNGQFIKENLKKLNDIVANDNEQYFIHCGSANRVIAWLLTYLPTHKRLSFNDSEQVAKGMGLTNSSFIEQAKNLLVA